MSSSQGRSWRPEKRIDRKKSRKSLIFFLAIVLTGLVAAIAFMLRWNPIPPLHFVVVTEHGFRLDETALTPLPTGATAFNSASLTDLGDRFREANPQLVGTGETLESVAGFAAGTALPADDPLIIYCAADAWCVPDKDDPQKTALELLPAKLSPGAEPVRFSDLLASLRKRTATQTLLLFEYTGRSPGLASGAVANDIPTQVREEIKRSGVPGLTVIGACSEGERSWEYVSENGIDPSKKTPDVVSVLPTFEGTAFGHFVQKAIEEGNADTSADLYKTVQKDVGEWVTRHFGESQTVWMASTDATAPELPLLQRVRRPKAKTPDSDSLKKKEGDSKDAAAAESTPADGQSEAAASSEVPIDDEPLARLKKLQEQRDLLSKQTETAVLSPAEWLELHFNLLAAEQFAMSGNRGEFNSLHDDVIRRDLKELERNATGLSPTPEQQAAFDWIAVESTAVINEEEATVLKRTPGDFKVEPGQAQKKLPEAFDNKVLRSALVATVTEDLKGLSKSIGDQGSDGKAALIKKQIFLMQNLAAVWPREVFPEQFVTITEVLSGDDIEWLAAATVPLVQLLEFRHQALQFAAGKSPDGRMLRREQWRQIAPDIDDVLKTLHSAERWLCVGSDGRDLANDRLKKASQSLEQLKKQVEISSQRTKIQDAQRFEIPLLIQYLAMRFEETSLPKEELDAAKSMADKAVSGTLKLGDFPAGQLKPAVFTQSHIDAMFHLTRDFLKQGSEVGDSDERYYEILKKFVDDRAGDADSVPASEALQLLSIPQLSGRDSLLRRLTSPRVGAVGGRPDSPARSGIWMSFWSLRLVDAIEQKSSTDDWQRWSDLVAVADDKAAAPLHRAALASRLRSRWIGAMESLKQVKKSDVFVPEQELVQLLAKDVARRSRATSPENRSLYSMIQQKLFDETPRPDPVLLKVLNEDAELSPDHKVTTNVRVTGAAEIYVLNRNDAVALSNEKNGKDRNWLHLPVGSLDETDVALELSLSDAPRAPVELTIVAVDGDGAAIRKLTTSLLPSSDHSWEIEVFEVRKGEADRQITLKEVQSQTSFLLPLLPSTLDPETQTHVPSELKLRLRRTKGTSRSVRIRAFHADSKAIAWSLAEPLALPEGKEVVDIPFHSPAATPETGAAKVAEVPEISRGLRFEITPDDLPKNITSQGKITSQITITPVLLRPDELLVRPDPVYDDSADELVIPLQRAPFNNSTALWPTKLPASVELSPKLQQCLRTPESTFSTLNADDGFEFRIPFNSTEIRKVLSEDGLEFGVSVAGIPHAWWWTLNGGDPQLLDGVVPQIRAFLSVDNVAEVKPVATAPNLLLGKDWDKAKLTARVFIHGGQFGDGWKLRLDFLREGTEDPIRATELPFEVRNRRVETVGITAGENGIWQFSTTTAPYVIPAFTPDRYMEKGTYDLRAELALPGSGDAPVTSKVRLTLDNTGPDLTADNVKLTQQKTNVSGTLSGTIKVTDDETDVVEVQVWLNPDMKVNLPLTPGRQVTPKFKLDKSHGFPDLEQKEKDQEKTVTLYVQAKNRAGVSIIEDVKKPVTFFLPGIPVPKPLVPGKIKFTANAKYDISVVGRDATGKPVSKKAADSAEATFDVPPGEYTVTWKPKVGTVSGNKKVTVRSDEEVPVGPDK